MNKRMKIETEEEKLLKKERAKALKKAKEKFYAVYFKDYDEGKIFKDYKQTREERKGKKSDYYTFLTEEDAQNFIEEKREENIKSIMNRNIKFYVAFFPATQTHRFFTDWDICKSETEGVTPYYKKFYKEQDAYKWIEELKQKETYMPPDYFLKLDKKKSEESKKTNCYYVCAWKSNGRIRSKITPFRREIIRKIKEKNVKFKICKSKEEAYKWIDSLYENNTFEEDLKRIIDFNKMYEYARKVIIEDARMILDEESRYNLFDWFSDQLNNLSEIRDEKEVITEMTNLDVKNLIDSMGKLEMDIAEFRINGKRIIIKVE